tara:strand:- start:394 stop:951 length:558 start_codon:yes stop_codon:yes gene_type:complete
MVLNTNKLVVLKEFSSNYHKRIYGREIAKKLKINQKTVSNVLNNLEKENILKYKKEGKNKYYYLNEFYSHLKEIIELIETQRKIDFLTKYKSLKELFLKLRKRTQGMLVIFGSYASLSANEGSDLDVFVLGKIKDTQDLEDMHNIKINVVKSKKDKFNKKEIIIKEIINNHIILKGKEEFIELLW